MRKGGKRSLSRASVMKKGIIKSKNILPRKKEMNKASCRAHLCVSASLPVLAETNEPLHPLPSHKNS